MATQGSDDIMALVWATEINDSSNLTSNNYSWWLWNYNVFDAITEEKEYANRVSRENLVKHLKERSNLRKAIRSWEKTTWDKQKDTQLINSTELVDWLTNVLVWLGKEPSELEKYKTQTGNVEAINKLKQLQWGKFSWDVQNFLEWKSSKDASWILADIFPEYMSSQWYWLASPEEMKYTDIADEWTTRWWISSPDERSAWEKMIEWASQFRWSDIGLESEWRPLKWLINYWAWIYEDVRKTKAWLESLINKAFMDKPEEFNKMIDEWKFAWDYDYDVSQWYTWSYDQRKEKVKKEYADKYETQTNLTKEIDKNKWNLWYNVVDEESKAFGVWELTTDVAEQILLDKWIGNVVKYGYDLYKWYKTSKNIAKWTELATKWGELAIPWTTAVADTEKVAKESKDIATKIIDWFKWEWAAKDIARWWLEWAKWWLEYQLIWDVQNWQLSDAQVYWISAWLWTTLWTIFWVFWAWWSAVTEPSEKLRTSLKRLWVQNVDDIVNRAEAASKDWTLPSAKQRVNNYVVSEAKKNVKSALDEAWKNLWEFRKSLWVWDKTVEDFYKTINKGLSDKWVWAQIIEKDGKYVVDWYPWKYWNILNDIAERMNSAVYNVKDKYARYVRWEQVDFWTNTSIYEDLLSDLKSFSIDEPNAEVRQKFIEIENSLMEDLKWAMWEKQYNTYKWYLEDYAKYKRMNKKVFELKDKMKSTNVNEQPEMSDEQYLSDFLEELYRDKKISGNAKDMRIAAIFADAMYWVPLRPWERVPYPPKFWWMEEVQKWLTKIASLPKNKVTWWWRKYAWDYKPSKTRTAFKKSAKQAKTTLIWEASKRPPEED